MIYVLPLVAIIAASTWAFVAFRHYGASQTALRKRQAAERSRHFSALAAKAGDIQPGQSSRPKGFGRR